MTKARKHPASFGQQYVGVRIRPFLQKEAQTDAKAAVAVAGEYLATINPDNGEMRPFLFDCVFDSTGISADAFASTTALFDQVKPILLDEGIFAGRNATCILTGAKLTGKSHTLLGQEEDPGIVPWLQHDIFDMMRETSGGPDGSRWRLWLSVYQVFEDRVYDVLSPDFQAKEGLKIREAKDKGAYVDGLCILRLKTLEDGMRAMNDISSLMSSEDHTSTLFYTFQLEKVRTDVTASISGLKTERKKKILQSAKLHVIDLPPSSRLQGAHNPLSSMMKAPMQDKSQNMLMQVLEKVRERQKMREKQPKRMVDSFAPSTSSTPSEVLVVDERGGMREREVKRGEEEHSVFRLPPSGPPSPPPEMKGKTTRKMAVPRGPASSTLSAANPADYIAFRACGLTKLLQDSIDEYANRVVIGHISPADSSFKENNLTLRALARVRGDQDGGEMRRELTPVPLPTEQRKMDAALPRSDETPTVGGGFRWTYSKGGLGAGPKGL
mmetsp:Transcript_5539/g.12751  ORF Transcript_5539/g.12751 Transcript_5539/m.12751 type:complete len:496 (-) Transcript_5539:2448-3935(-)